MTTTIAAAAASTTTTTTRCNEYFPQRSRIKRELDEQLSVLPDELRRDHGFLPLPKKFNILVTLFNEMEKVVQHAYSREQRKTFAEIAKNVEKNSKRKFTEKHLAQIVAVYPTAYALRWERSRDRRAVQLGLWDLMMQPNLERNQDLASFASAFHCTSAVTSFKDNAESKLLEKTATTKSSNKEEEEAADSNGEKSIKNGWAIPADESQQPQLQQQSPGKRMTPLPLSPVKLISPIKKSRANAADFIYRSPTKPVGGSSRAQRTIAFCTPVLDRRIRMDANRLKWRKLIFRHLLVERVREAHRKFLAEHKLEFHDPQSVHAQFRPSMDELVADIGTEGAIPRRPQQQQQANSSGRPNLQATDIRTFLQSVNRMDRQKTPERQPSSAISKSEPQTPQQPGMGAVKFEPKTPLEERLKAKFAANQAARAAGLPEMQKRRALLYRLDNSILELLRAHLNLEQRFSVAVTDRVLLQKLGKEINAASLLEHLRLLCQLLPPSAGVCWLESLAPHRGKNDGGLSGGPDSHFFKVSKEMGPEWAQRARAAVKEELATLEQKMARTPLHRSPSSCF